MDESGFLPSDQGRRRVVGRAGNKTQHKTGGAGREMVTAIITICADGTKLVPTLIFKAGKIRSAWTANNVAEARYVFGICY